MEVTHKLSCIRTHYVHLIDLVIACQVHGNDSAESDTIRDELDTTWYQLDQDAMDLFATATEKLTKYVESVLNE